MELIRRLYAPDHMIKASQKLEPSYNTREIYKSFLKVAWPAAMESLLMGLVNFIDSIMISSEGHVAIAAVGLTSQPRFIFYAIFFALNVGVTAIVSRRKGENRKEDANRVLAQALSVCLILGVVLVSVAYIFSEPLLRFSGAKDDTIAHSMTYFRITMIGLFFTSIGMTINAAQRGVGKTRISMTTNMTANIVNCIFNAILINGLFFFPQLGVTGAAIATLIGNIVSCSMSIFSVMPIKRHEARFLKLHIRSLFHFDRENIGLIAKISSSAAVEQVFIRLGFFLVSKQVAELSTVDFATHTICMNITNLSFCFGDGLGVAASSLVGQNLGKKRPDLSMIYGKTAQRIGFVIAMGLFCLFTLGGEMMIKLFMTDEAEAEQILMIGVRILQILAIISPAQISQVIYSGCIRGAGDTKYTATVSLLTIAIERPLLTYLLCYTAGLGVIGAWLAMLVDQLLRMSLMAIRFSGGKWMKIKV